MRLLLPILALLTAAPAFAQDALDQALAEASASVAPCAGKSIYAMLGMSNYERFQQDVYQRWMLSPRPPEARILRNAISNHTAKEWADPNNNGWYAMAQKVAALGAQPCAVQWALIGLTNASPQKYGVMTETQLDAIVTNLLTFYPSVRAVQLGSLNTTFCDSPCLAPWWSVEGDDALLASYAGVRSYLVRGQTVRIPVQYLPVWRLEWRREMLELDAVHPNLTSGTPFGGSYLFGMLPRWLF